MVCDIVSAEETLKTAVKRADKLAETMEITREGEVVADTKASAEKALVLLKARDFTGLAAHIKEEFSHTLSTSIVREQLGGRFKATIAIDPKQGTKKATYVLKSARIFKDPKYGKMVEVKVTPEGGYKYYTYAFSHSSNVSHPSKEGNTKIRIENFKYIHTATTEGVEGVHNEIARIKNSNRTSANLAAMGRDIDKATSLEELMGSSANHEEQFRYKKNSEKEGYKHGDVESMRNILSDLNAIGNKPTDPKMYEYYDGLLKTMHQRFFREMDLYINENEDTAAGWVALKRGDKSGEILINASKTNSGMSNAEVYMHEVIHTMTTWALKNKNPNAIKLKQRLNYLRAQAFKSITWQKLEKADPNLSPHGAKELFKYMFNGKTADDEFLAHALTNPAVMSLLEKVSLKDTRKLGLLNSIKDFFTDLINAVMGHYKFSQRNSNVKQEVHALAFMMAEVNGKAKDDLKTNINPAVRTFELLRKIDGSIAEVISSTVSWVFDTKGEVIVPENMNTIQEVMFLTKFFAKSIYNSNYRHEAGRFFSWYGLGARNSVREVVRSVLPAVHEHLTIAAEFLGLSGTNVDRLINNHVANVADSIIKNFGHTLTDSDQEALTSIIMEANGSSLFTSNKNNGKGYSTAQIIKLIDDTHYRKQTIATLKRRISKIESKEANWINSQAEGLGMFMATGKGHKAQNTNSRNIVKGYLGNVRRKDNDKLLALAEELASLTAIEHQGSSNRGAVVNLLKTEEKGVRNVVKLYEAFKENSKQLFKDDEAHTIEGYIKQLYDDGIETKYAVMSEREDLEKQGFVLKTVTEANDLSGAEAVGFFVSDSNARADRLSGAVALGNPGSRGMTLKEVRYTQFKDSDKQHAHVWFEADKAKHDADAVEINKQLTAGTSVDAIEEGPVPVLDATGNVVDYRNMMPKRDKARYLNQNRKIIDVLSKTSGTVIAKMGRIDQNKKVLEVITKNLREVHDKNSIDNQLEYTYISATSEDPEMRKLFYQLPKSFQRVANSREDKSLPIPDILMDQYFGYSQARLTDMPGVEKLPESIKRIINMIEKVWVDIVKIAKGNILLKMPIILVKNIVSNALYAISTGTNPLELVSAYYTSIKDVNKLMKNHKALESKKIELMSLSQTYNTVKFNSIVERDAYFDEVARLSAEIKRLEKEGKEFESLSELIEMGMYQAVIEDVNMYKLGDTNIISDTGDRLTKNMPKVIKTPTQWLFLSKETAWYRANQYILQMSDLVARDVMNKKMKIQEKEQVEGKRDLPLWYRKEVIGKLNPKKAEGGMGPEEKKRFLALAKHQRHTSLLKSFVNYASPNGRGEEWLNRVGVLMFTKYIKRIQQVITNSMTEHPVTTLLTLAAATLSVDLEMIQDSSFLAKIGNDFGVLGITPIYDPSDIMALVLIPPIVRLYNAAH